MSVQKYRVFQSRLIAINDDSVFNIACHSVVVTHADYRALEEELAALRGKTAELVASVEAHEYERVTGSARWNKWAVSQKDGHLDRMTDTQERRRLALEALK